MLTIIIVLLAIVILGGGIFIWHIIEQSKEPEVTRKWTDPKNSR